MAQTAAASRRRRSLLEGLGRVTAAGRTGGRRCHDDRHQALFGRRQRRAHGTVRGFIGGVLCEHGEFGPEGLAIARTNRWILIHHAYEEGLEGLGHRRTELTCAGGLSPEDLGP